jgi:hypothetical protein
MFFPSGSNEGEKMDYELERIWKKVIVVYCIVFSLRISLKGLRQATETTAATATLQTCEFQVGPFQIRISGANH